MNDILIDNKAKESEFNKEEFEAGLKKYFKQSARAWQSYISYEFIKDIKLSDSQKTIVSAINKQTIINGSAGSGKSIVLLYKLIKMMKESNTPKRFLYLSYNRVLIDDMRKRAALCEEYDELKKKHDSVKICTFHEFARDLLQEMGYNKMIFQDVTYCNIEKVRATSLRRVAAILHKYKQSNYRSSKEFEELEYEERLYSTHDEEFIRDEIIWMKANGYVTKEKYYSCERTGRGNSPRLTNKQRKTVYKIFEEYSEEIEQYKYGKVLTDLEDYALLLLKKLDEIPDRLKYNAILVDESQDFDAMQLKLLVSLNPEELILAGDPKQRIYKRAPLSYSELGIEYKGNVKNLNENFRSTAQIMKLANSLQFTDIVKDNKRIRYVNKGPLPEILFFDDGTRGLEFIADRIKEIKKQNPRHTVAIITREEHSKASGNSSNIKLYLSRYFRFIDIEGYGKKFKYGEANEIIYTDVYNVKGLEFDHVFLLNFDKSHYPNNENVRQILKYDKGLTKQSQDYIDLINAEKKLLYVAMSRAKKTLQMYCIAKSPDRISEFIDDFNTEDFIFKEAIGRRRMVERRY